MKYKYFLVATIATLFLGSCYKYDKEMSYATIKGSFVDKFTNTNLDVGDITLSPARVVNGSLNIDTAGRFTNTRILPGTYKVYGSIKAAFTSDSAEVVLPAGSTGEVILKIEPWISIRQSIATVTDTTATVTYTINGNRGMIPARHAIMWSTAPKPNISSQPGGARNFYIPAAGAQNGTFTYKITGLKWNTTYFVVSGARIADAALNPNNDYNYSRQVIIQTPSRP